MSQRLNRLNVRLSADERELLETARAKMPRDDRTELYLDAYPDADMWYSPRCDRPEESLSAWARCVLLREARKLTAGEVRHADAD